jgi:acyl carrier protein
MIIEGKIMNELLKQRITERREILQGIKEELIDRLQLYLNPCDIDDDTYLFGGGLQLDSIDAMEIVIGMQARFEVVVPEGDVSSLRTINTLADLVQASRAAQPLELAS